MWDFNWWDGLWPETEWREEICLQVSGEAGIRLQGECAADIARTGEPTGQRPKNKQLFQIVSSWSTVLQHALEFHQKPKQERYGSMTLDSWELLGASQRPRWSVLSGLYVAILLGKIGKQYFWILGKVSWTGKAWRQFAAAWFSASTWS